MLIMEPAGWLDTPHPTRWTTLISRLRLRPRHLLRPRSAYQPPYHIPQHEHVVRLELPALLARYSRGPGRPGRLASLRARRRETVRRDRRGHALQAHAPGRGADQLRGQIDRFKTPITYPHLLGKSVCKVIHSTCTQYWIMP